MVTSAREWKGRIETQGTELELPSQNVALVKPISPTELLIGGYIPDPLTNIMRQAITEAKGLPPEKLNDIVNDEKTLAATLQMFDQVVSAVVIEPAVMMPPPCDVKINGEPCNKYATDDVHKDPQLSGKHRYHEGERDPDVLYADMIDFGDKMFIFQWCLGGTRDLEQFRQEQDERLATLSDGEVVPSKAKRATRRK